MLFSIKSIGILNLTNDQNLVPIKYYESFGCSIMFAYCP
jgi:hypothetical protein